MSRITHNSPSPYLPPCLLFLIHPSPHPLFNQPAQFYPPSGTAMTATIMMDPSYITHQRRFALIPHDSSTLSAEDEQAVRMRTGNVIPKNKTTSTSSSSSSLCTSLGIQQVSVQQQEQHDAGQHDAEQYLAKTSSANENDCRGTKRKASTTAEGYHAAVILDEEDASASVENRDDPREKEEVDLETKGQ